MAYQTLTIVKSLKDGLRDLESLGVVWDNTTYKQGLKFANPQGKTILIARSDTTPADDWAAWNTDHVVGTYAAKLVKAASATDRSTHVQFTPATGITVSAFCTAIDAATPVYSFAHWLEVAPGVQNGPQFELRFEDPDSDAWLEITVVPLQAYTGTGGWVTTTIADTHTCGYGGRTPNGTSVFVWTPPLTSMAGLEATIDGVWDTAEQDESIAAYLLERVRIEYWEQDPERTAWIDTVIIAGVTYALEPGLAGVQLGPNAPLVTLSFVAERDKFVRTETLAPVLGASQSLIVGPFLQNLWNDTSGYVRFKPDVTGNDKYYTAIQVIDPS